MLAPSLNLHQISKCFKQVLKDCTINTTPRRTYRVWYLEITAEVYNEFLALSLPRASDYLKLIRSAEPPRDGDPFSINIEHLRQISSASMIERIFQQRLLNWLKLYRALVNSAQHVVAAKKIPLRAAAGDGGPGDFYVEIRPSDDRSLAEAGGDCFRFEQMEPASVEGAFATWKDRIVWDDAGTRLPTMAMVLIIPTADGLEDQGAAQLSMLKSFRPWIERMLHLLRRSPRPVVSEANTPARSQGLGWEVRITAEPQASGLDPSCFAGSLSYTLPRDAGHLDLGSQELAALLPGKLLPYAEMIPGHWLVLTTRHDKVLASLPGEWRYPHTFSVVNSSVIKRARAGSTPTRLCPEDQVLLTHSDPGCPFRFRLELQRM